MNFPLNPALGWAQIILLLTILCLLVKPLGLYLARVMNGDKHVLSPVLGWAERTFYALCGIDPNDSMTAREYFFSLCFFSVLCFAGLLALLLLQDFPVISLDLAINIAASFVTNTNWQSYAPESTLTNFTQMTGLAVENFLSPAVGLALMTAFARALSASHDGKVGNFWTDITRGIVYIFLPFAFLFAIFLVSQGVVQSFHPTQSVLTLEGKAEQVLTLGPVASQVAIKQLGTNGGGFFNANAAHPFENPTPLSNFMQILAMLLIPISLTVAFGKMVGQIRQGWVLFAAMALLFVPILLAVCGMEQAANPTFASLGIDSAVGNLQGKELRFGTLGSALWTVATTATASGSLNASLDSFFPLSTLAALSFIQFGEIVFGGIGSGIYGMLVFVFLTVFVAGLMIGRTPEYLGKKIGIDEMKMVALIILLPALATLVGTAVAVMTEAGRAGVSNPGAQGFTQILYAFASASNNNGSALGGLNANTPFFNIALALCMLAGRYGTAAALMVMASKLSRKVAVQSSVGTLSTDTPLFTLMLIGVIVLVGLLTYVPALALGPIVEHLQLFARG